MDTSGDADQTRWSQDRLDLPNDDDEAVIVSAQDVFHYLSAFDDSLGSTQGSTDKIRTKLVESMGHWPRRTGGVPPARSEVGSKGVSP